MLNLNLNLKLNDPEFLVMDDPEQTNDTSGIAVIGIDAKVGSALTSDQIWQVFAQGLDLITDLPEQRKSDAQHFAQVAFGRNVQMFSQRAYLPSIDQFDPGPFNIAPTEAELMDPVQRIFLESAWSAVEDAGYGGGRLQGSKTGVYVGFNHAGQGYEVLLKDIQEEKLGVMLSGNVGSFLASRLSYLLNLTGPAMVIDTACSSSLVALHQACKALQYHEIDMAVVGSIRIFFCPERSGESIGTTSSSERTKTFDETADGTGGGEGVINLVLKPLKSAIAAREHIYGVIKGSSANQDGSSIGITAPNSAAQEAVIIEAWDEAGIDPESVTYIEAHGTATKLGDPVEIGGITGAFSRFTERKQFCAIGAAKSNFGHLDCASGLLGVLKVLLMMEHHMIPPSIHFNSPNRKIDYIQSPVYVNDRLRLWKGENGVLTAGVSSFGLSGTNCHVVLQSYESPVRDVKTNKKQLLTASAREKETLQNLLLSYQRYLREHPETDLESFCYTLNTGRDQNRCRFAMVLQNAQEFLHMTPQEMLAAPYFGVFRVVPNRVEMEAGFITNDEQRALTERANLLCSSGAVEELVEPYLRGAQIDFMPLYDGCDVYRLSLPTYPFCHKRYWYMPNQTERQSQSIQKPLHPLIDSCCMETYGLRIYEKKITLDRCPELREHRINGVCVMPGTVYVDIAQTIGREWFGSDRFVLASVTFFSLMTCSEKEQRLLHAIVREENGGLQITMASRGADGAWLDHVEAILRREAKSYVPTQINLQELLERYPEVYTQRGIQRQNFVSLGERWQTGQTLYVNSDSVVLFSDVPQRYKAEAAQYSLYPPLLDGSMNSVILLLDGQYLPINYKNACFRGNLAGKTYSVITRNQMKEASDEIVTVHVEMFDENGILIGEVEEYSLKRVNQAETFLKEKTDALHEIQWEQAEEDSLRVINGNTSYAIVLLKREQETTALVKSIHATYKKTVLLYLSEETKQLSKTAYCVKNDVNDMRRVLQELVPLNNVTIIDLLAFAQDSDDLTEGIRTKLQSAFHMVKALSGFVGNKTFVVIVQEASCITAREDHYHPLNQALVGFASCLEAEQSNLDVCILDADQQTNPERLIGEILGYRDRLVIGYRENRRYIERLSKATRNTETIPMEAGDTIVIGGGYGGIGLAVSDWIFRKYPHTKIVLLTRNGGSETDYRKGALERLREAGCQITVLRADVSDAVQTANALDEVRQMYGRIDGLILSAGVAGDGMVANKSWDAAEKVLKPKLYGAYNLDYLTKNDVIKYFILFSSFTSVTGAPGQADYAAANAYLDAFTYARNRLGRRTMTINWTGWKESGMARNHNVDTESSAVKFVTDEEGKMLFANALELGASRVIACQFRERLSGIELEQLQRRITLPKGVIEVEPKTTILSEETEAPIIYGKSQDKLTAVEQNIALAWARTLHVNEVNIYDKFFEIGGNSLLASYLQKEINCIYPDAMAITDVFVYSTIADIATYISGKLGICEEIADHTSYEENDIEDLVQQFMSGKLTIEDMEILV